MARSYLLAPWAWFVSAIDWALRVYLRETNPKHAVAVFVVVNLVAGVLSVLVVGNWVEALTLSGYVLTVTGFLVAIGELYRARTAAEGVQDALRQERARHYRFCLERAKSSLAEAKTCATARGWTHAVIRLNDLVVHLSYVNSISPAADDRWTALANSTHAWVVDFSRGKNGRRLEYNTLEWERFAGAVLFQLDNELAVFQPGEEVDDGTE